MSTDEDREASRPSAAVRLAEHARGLLHHAHVPYSDFPVAAAVLDETGRLHGGVNVENASYGLTMCAERVAIFTAVAAGAKRLQAIAVSATRLPGITPCGACRQVMVEFFDASSPVYSDAGDHIVRRTVGELQPFAFDADALSPGD